MGGGAVSKLPFIVPSKCVQGTIGLDNQRVVISCGDLSDAGGENLGGGRPVGGGAVSELPVIILSKSMQGPIVFENEGVILPPKAGANEKGENEQHPISKQAQPGQGRGFVSQAAHLGFGLARGVTRETY